MPSTTRLVASAITGVGVVGGGIGAFYAKQYFSKEAPAEIQNSKPTKISFRKRLQDNGKKLLDQHTSEQRLEYKLETYKKVKDSLSFKLEPEDVATLRTFCETRLDSESEEPDPKLIADLEKICTSPTNKERLQKEGKNLIDGDSEWEKRARDYKSNNNGSDTIAEIEKSTADKTIIQKWCNEKIEKEYEDDGDYATFLQWCTKERK